MDYHLQKVKVDSLRVRIPAKHCTNHTVAGRYTLLSTEDDGVLHSNAKVMKYAPRGAEELTREFGEIKFEIQKHEPKNDRITFPPYFQITLSAKMLGEKYFEGLTKDNLRIAYNFYQRMPNPLIFSYDTLLKSTITDVDLCYDVEASPEEWQKLVYGISASVDIEKIEPPKRGNKGDSRIFDRKGNIGLEFMDRKKATPTKPFIKFYHKGLELTNRSKKWWNLHFPHHQFVNVGRYEMTVPDEWWKKKIDYVVSCLEELLTLDLETLKKYIMKQTRMSFLRVEERAVRKSGTKSQTDRMIEWLLEDWLKRGGTSETWLNQLEVDSADYGASGTQKSRTKKDMYARLKAVEDTSPLIQRHMFESGRARSIGRELGLWD